MGEYRYPSHQSHGGRLAGHPGPPARVRVTQAAANQNHGFVLLWPSRYSGCQWPRFLLHVSPGPGAGLSLSESNPKVCPRRRDSDLQVQVGPTYAAALAPSVMSESALITPVHDRSCSALPVLLPPFKFLQVPSIWNPDHLACKSMYRYIPVYTVIYRYILCYLTKISVLV